MTAPNKGPSPLLGYNTNVRHKGKLYHIQTEDSGVRHPHIITHLFADGGRIVSSRKTSYAEHVGTPDLAAAVKKMMQDQHKAMFIALRDGIFDEESEGADTSELQVQVDVEAFERAADRLSAGTTVDMTAPGATAPGVSSPGVATAPGSVRPVPSPGLYQTTQPAAARARTPERAPESIFGSDLLSEKSLDEVILSYLAEDLEEPKE